MKQLIKEYQESLMKVRQGQKKLVQKRRLTEEELENLRMLRSMENDLLWTIEWLENGQQPGPRRGIENRATYQREIFWSQISAKSQRLIEYQNKEQTRKTDQTNQWLEDMLNKLSKSEYEAFVAVRGEGLSFAQTAQLLKCSKSTVQSYVQRAEGKLRQYSQWIDLEKNKVKSEPYPIVIPTYQSTETFIYPK